MSENYVPLHEVLEYLETVDDDVVRSVVDYVHHLQDRNKEYENMAIEAAKDNRDARAYTWLAARTWNRIVFLMPLLRKIYYQLRDG